MGQRQVAQAKPKSGPCKDQTHQLNDSDARIQMLTEIGEFLDHAIGH